MQCNRLESLIKCKQMIVLNGLVIEKKYIVFVLLVDSKYCN